MSSKYFFIKIRKYKKNKDRKNVVVIFEKKSIFNIIYSVKIFFVRKIYKLFKKDIG